MRILFIAPLPPPITGHSLASEVLFEEIKRNNEVTTINLSKKSFIAGIDSIGRVKEVLQILWKVLINVWKADKIYLTISESIAGNFKDILIYGICFFKLNNFFIHLHGGSIKKLLFDKNKMIYKINIFFIKRLAGVIVLGESHVVKFSSFIDREKIFIVPNFSQDYLFLSDQQVQKKQKLRAQKMNILFLSNMQIEKGYNELLTAYIKLDNKFKERIELNFAGQFEFKAEETLFLEKIKGIKGTKYHGTVDGEIKKELFARANVFCLPTSFLEGQPVSILEAYASGCLVLTTLKGGIIDIFEDEVNGIVVENSSESIKDAIKLILCNPQKLLEIGLNNRRTAIKKYRTSIYNESIKKVLF